VGSTDNGVTDRRPPSQRIADDLRGAIERGQLAAGEKLPSERALARKYGTARNTAREATRLLAVAGLVVVQHGKGTFVRSTGPLIRLGNDRYSPRHRKAGIPPFQAECERQGKVARVEMLAVERVIAPNDIAERLELPAKQRSVVRRESVSYADDDAVHRVTTWIPWATARGTGLTRADTGHPRGIYGVLEAQGHQMSRLREEVDARMPTPDEIDVLGLPPGVPMLDVLHTSIDQHGQPYELTRFVMRADLTGLVYNSPIE
jgi:GntR family transcriptional regulator